MKKSKDWVRKPDLEKLLDQLVDEGGYAIEDLNAYEAAKVLNLSNGGEFYRTFRFWKEGRIAKSVVRPFEVPPEDQKAFREIAVNFADSATEQFLHLARKLGGEIDRAASLRIADAEKRAADTRSENEEITDRWCEVEAKLAAANKRVDELEKQSIAARRREDQLLGRIDQLNLILHGRELPIHTEFRLSAERENPRLTPLVPDNSVFFMSDEEFVAQAIRELDQDMHDRARAINNEAGDNTETMPLAIEASPPEEGQSEMPLVIIDPAQEASINND